MTISVGDNLPEATLLRMGAEGPESVELSTLTKGKKTVIFGLPGAYTGTCTTSHVPSFINAKDDLAAKGVDEIICVSVNDPFVMGAWGESTGASNAGIQMLGDPSAAFIKAIGLDFTAPPAGLYDRSQRFALFAEDGEVKVLNLEDNPGVCDISGGASMVDQI